MMKTHSLFSVALVVALCAAVAVAQSPGPPIFCSEVIGASGGVGKAPIAIVGLQPSVQGLSGELYLSYDGGATFSNNSFEGYGINTQPAYNYVSRTSDEAVFLFLDSDVVFYLEWNAKNWEGQAMDGSQPSIDTIVWNTNEFMAISKDGTKLIHAEAGLRWYELANMTSGFDFVVGVLTSDLETNPETAFFGKPSQGSDASAFAVAVVDDNGSFVTQTTFKTPSPGTLNGAALINIAQYLVTTTDTVWFVDTEQNTLTPLATANSSSVVYSSPVVVGNDMFVAYFDGERAAVIYAKATSPSTWTDVTPFAEGPLTAAPIVLAVAGDRVWLAAGISAPSKTGSSAVYASTTGGQFELIANAATSCSQE